jgi:hypothetical protein
VCVNVETPQQRLVATGVEVAEPDFEALLVDAKLLLMRLFQTFVWR